MLSPTLLAAGTVLSLILGHARSLHDAGTRPVIVMDLDETVIDSTPRRFHSIQKALNEVALTPQERQALSTIGFYDLYRLENRYDLTPIYQKLAISKDTASRFDAYVVQVYLSGFGLEYDVPMAGADHYVQELRDAGARIIFVSSRYDRTQRQGTVANLIALKMLEADQACDVILRPDGMTSIDFKRWAFSQITGDVIGVFENEPENINAMVEAFPKAQAVFMEGAWIHPGPISPQAVQITDYIVGQVVEEPRLTNDQPMMHP